MASSGYARDTYSQSKAKALPLFQIKKHDKKMLVEEEKSPACLDGLLAHLCSKKCPLVVCSVEHFRFLGHNEQCCRLGNATVELLYI